MVISVISLSTTRQDLDVLIILLLQKTDTQTVILKCNMFVHFKEAEPPFRNLTSDIIIILSVIAYSIIL